jgi:hypothetical protein
MSPIASFLNGLQNNTCHNSIKWYFKETVYAWVCKIDYACTISLKTKDLQGNLKFNLIFSRIKSVFDWEPHTAYHNIDAIANWKFKQLLMNVYDTI